MWACRWSVSIPPILALLALEYCPEAKLESTVWHLLNVLAQPNSSSAASNPPLNEKLDLAMLVAARLLVLKLRDYSTFMLHDLLHHFKQSLPPNIPNLELRVPQSLELQKVDEQVTPSSWAQWLSLSQPGCYINGDMASFADSWALFEVAKKPPT